MCRQPGKVKCEHDDRKKKTYNGVIFVNFANAIHPARLDDCVKLWCSEWLLICCCCSSTFFSELPSNCGCRSLRWLRRRTFFMQVSHLLLWIIIEGNIQQQQQHQNGLPLAIVSRQCSLPIAKITSDCLHQKIGTLEQTKTILSADKLTMPSIYWITYKQIFIAAMIRN